MGVNFEKRTRSLSLQEIRNLVNCKDLLSVSAVYVNGRLVTDEGVLGYVGTSEVLAEAVFSVNLEDLPKCLKSPIPLVRRLSELRLQAGA